MIRDLETNYNGSVPYLGDTKVKIVKQSGNIVAIVLKTAIDTMIAEAKTLQHFINSSIIYRLGVVHSISSSYFFC